MSGSTALDTCATRNGPAESNTSPQVPRRYHHQVIPSCRARKLRTTKSKIQLVRNPPGTQPTRTGPGAGESKGLSLGSRAGANENRSQTLAISLLPPMRKRPVRVPDITRQFSQAAAHPLSGIFGRVPQRPDLCVCTPRALVHRSRKEANS